MKINSLKQAEEILQSYISGINKTGDDQSLERMWPLLEAAGNPHEKLKVIHVAGTSGKTSTCYFIASILQASGKKVGLTVSPHVDSITERVQINGEPLSQQSFCSELGEFLELIDGIGSPSYFEILIVFVLWEFVRRGVDYVVLETGMGGLFDGTNVVTRSDKVCVITDIGFDHMHVLGNTLESIAYQKAGIIHKHNTVFSQKQKPEAMRQIVDRARQKNATLTINDKMLIATKSQLASYQQRNWLLADMTARFVAVRDDFSLVDVDPVHITVPGRMEILAQKDDSLLVMDGAHNEQKMQAFVESFQIKFPGQKATVMLALKQGKDLSGVIDAVEPIASKIIVSTFTAYQDLPFTSKSPESIAAYVKTKKIEVVTISNHEEAYGLLKQTPGIKVVTGSFYLLGQVRKLL